MAEFWKSHTNADGQIVWPDTAKERDALARALFGLCFMEAIDYWLARADDFLDKSTAPSEPWMQKAEDLAYRPTFAAMTKRQRDIIRNLVRETAHGVLFSSLVHVDQVPSGKFDVLFVEGAGQGTVHPARDDLHDGLYEWIWQFSDFRDQLMGHFAFFSFVLRSSALCSCGSFLVCKWSGCGTRSGRSPAESFQRKIQRDITSAIHFYK